MNITGIIAEYDPFHNGHAYHITATKAAGASHIIVVLGGNFTQRGEAALLMKADRVRMALAGGADLVVELPQPWASASAEGFAFGAVSLLDQMKCVDTVSFGSECGNTDLLLQIASCMQTAKFTSFFRESLKAGIPYASAVQQTVTNLLGETAGAVLSSPNNTLGLEYCKALHKRNSSIRPLTILREGVAHNQVALEGDITSASHIRALLLQGKLEDATPYLPASSVVFLKESLRNGHCLTDTNVADRIMLSYLRRLNVEQLATSPYISEGLENRLFSAIQQSTSMEELLQTLKTKRYPLSRIRRILTASFLGVNAAWETQSPPYIRVLGMRDSGVEILHRMRKSALLPLFTDAKQPPESAFSKEIFEFECKASDLYGSLLPSPVPCGSEFTNGMLKYREET